MKKINYIFSLLLIVFCHNLCVFGELEKILHVSESAQPGTSIGTLGSTYQHGTTPNYYIVWPDQEFSGEDAIQINDITGEISVLKELDYETKAKFVFLAIPTDGSISSRNIILVTDENDNSPTFPVDHITLEISEYAQLNTQLALPLASDPDSDKYSIQKYVLVGGNVNNVFRLSSRTLSDVIYVDLVVNGQLDREYRSRYELTIEAVDGGNPSKSGRLNATVLIIDVNDNLPEFSKSKYYATIHSNASIDDNVLTVKATDLDEGENGRVSYKIIENNDKSSRKFKIDEDSGVIKVAEQGSFIAGAVYEILLSVEDHGFPQKLENSVFVQIKIAKELNNFEANLDIVWLTDDGLPQLYENVTIGYIFARISVKDMLPENELILTGNESFCLRQSDKIDVFLLVVCGSLDREQKSTYLIKFILKKRNSNEIIFDNPVHFQMVTVLIMDINDNSPLFSQKNYHIKMIDGIDEIYEIVAHDIDFGNNSRIVYSIIGTDLFSINNDSGVITKNKELDCNAGAEISFKVKAVDMGEPKQSSFANVIIDITALNSKPPLFEKSLYEIEISEDTKMGTCFIKVSANDNSCQNAREHTQQITYLLKDTHSVFEIDKQNGKICIVKQLDYEQITRYQLTVQAIDQLNRNATSLVVIRVKDANDNIPIFMPLIYNVSITNSINYQDKLIRINAIDLDSDLFGKIKFDIEKEFRKYFIIDKSGTMLIASDIGELLQNVTTFKIEATDGGGMTSHEHAVVNIIPFEQHNLIFTERIYYYNVSEDILPGIAIGNVFLRDQNYDDVDLEIYGGNSNSLFAIESDGSITVLKYLNTNHRDSFLLNVLVQDKKNLRKNYCQVEFRIIDMNNHVPEMDKEMIVNVLENYPLHEPFYAIFATDKDRLDNGRVTFEILNSDPPSPVVIRPLTGELVLAASLDYELIKNYQLKVKATDQGLPPKSSISVIYLNVVDVNNMAPIFESQLYTATINEDAPTMTEIVTVKATDGDSGINAKVYYSIVQDSNKFDETFGINKSNGLLFLRKTLDREIISEYHLTVSASDRGSPQLSSNCTVQIKIVDINDNIPNCASIQSPFYLSELQDLNTALGKIAAYDPDLGDNGVIYYRLQQTNENFEVRRNGEIYLRRKAANICELNVSNKLSVIAEDAGTPSLSSVCLIDIRCEHESAKVKIIEPFNNVIYVPSKCADGCFAKKINATNAFQYNLVKDDVSNHFIIRNDNEIWIKAGNIFEETDLQKSKRFNLDILDDNQRKKRVSFLLKSLHVSELVNKANKNDTILLKLSEKLLIGTKLAVIGKKPDKYYYKMVNKDPHVLLNEEEGTLFLSRKFEYADQQIHEIRVRRFSRDPEIEEEHNEFNVIIEVIEENTHYPFFTRNIVSFNVSEDSSPGLIIGRVNASDIDSGINGAVNYKIKGSQSLFTIDDVTGEIFLQQKLDYHSTKQHFVVIEAIDRSGNVNDRKQSACTVLINVLNSNHAPIFVSINNITVPENQLSSEPFHFVSAVDKDNDESLYYEIDKTDNFRIDNKTGAVYLLSRSGLQKQIITVKAIDKGNKIGLQKIQVNFVSSSNKWIYFEKSVYRFPVDKSIGNDEIALNSFKRRGREAVKFRIYPEIDEIKNIFSIGIKDGILKANKRRMNKREYEFNIYTFDTSNFKNSDWTTIKIEVLHHSNDLDIVPLNIVSSSCGNISVPENVALQNFNRIFAVNSNGENLKFKIVAGNYNDLFSINEKNGEMNCKELDYEEKNEYILIVSVTNDAVPARGDTCSIFLMVIDQNDNVPVFSNNMLDTIRLTDELNTHIMKLEAKDLDSGRNGELLFNLLEDEMGIFDVISDTGDLVLAKITNVDKPEWIITVSVQDNGAYRILSSTRQIRVVNERKKKITKNLESPMFLKQKYIGHVNENIRGEFVMQLGNNDFSSFGKSDAPISFSIIGGNKDSAFEIDNAGRIKTTKELDAEIEDNYSLNIIALNEYSRSSSTICHIKVLNLNDNLPFFAVQRPKKISESILIGTQIAVVNANDADGDLIYYSINPASEYFEVEKFTGAIFLKQSLDYETIKEHELGIQAYDGEHVATTFLKIIVIDENDNKPTFIGGSFQQINIADNSPPNANIHTVIAKDNDDSFNGQITYALINSPSDYFSLNSTSGVIKLLKKPIVEGTHHIMMISASDKGVIPQTSILTLKVQSISGSEMRIPQFRESSIKFAILEDHPVYETFGKLELKENYRMPLEFVIKDIDAAKIFHINNEGYISLKRKVDRETKSSYLFNVYLSQYNDNRGETCSVSLNVIDVNDNFPVLLANSTKKIYLNENLSKDTILGKIYAVDLDFQRNGAIGYSILSGNDFNMVSINSENGVIKFEKWDDQIIYQKNLQDLVILVKDHGTPQKMNVIVVSVVIDIKTWSGMAPFFVMPTFVFYVSEDTLANTVIASTQAVSRFGIHGDDWTYSLTNNPSNFGVNIATGYLILKEPLDYEKKTSYDFQIIVQDAKERKAISRIVIEVISVDEFAPAFTKPSYTFKLSTSADVGFVIGSVKAVDNDSGSHGKVTYSIHGSNVKMIGIDPTSGVLMLRESMTNKIIKANKTLEHLIVEAASSATQSSRANIYLEIGHFDLPPSDSLLVEDFSYIIIISAVCFVILAVICTLGCMRLCKDSPNNTKRVQNLYETQKRMPDISNISAGFDSPKYIKSNVPLPPIPFNTASSNSSQDFSMYDKNGDSTVAFRLSRHENNRSHPDSGIDQDNLSINTTVTEYLSQIGVTPLNKYFDSSLKKPLPKHDSSDFNDFMYTKVDEILGSTSNYQIKGPPILSSYTTQIPRSSTYFRNEDLNASPQFRSIISILGRK